MNAEMKLRQRAFYYMAIFVDPTNPEVAYAPEVDGVYKTKDGGKTFTAKWIRRTATITSSGSIRVIPKIILVGDDGGGTVSVDGGDHLEQRTQSAHRAVLSRRARQSVSVSRIRRSSRRRRIRRRQRRRRPGHRPRRMAFRRAGREHVHRSRPRRRLRDVRQRLLQFVRAPQPHYR